MTDRTRIGFIGLGLMGRGIARNLLEKGRPLTVLGNRNRQPVEALVAAGAREGATPAAVAGESDIVFLCVPSSVQVEAIVEGPDGIAADGRKGLTVIDCTTADPNSTDRLRDVLAERGITLIDAPLARTPKEAEEGRLNVMVGAEQADFDTIRPVLEGFAENIFHVGPPGAGHKIKLINNFIALGTAGIIAEAVNAAAGTGVDMRKLHEVVSGGGANSAMFQMVMAWVLDGDPSRMQFSIANAQKDLGYYAGLVDAHKMVAPLAHSLHQSYMLGLALAPAGAFVPALGDVLAKLNHTPLR